MSAAHQVSMVVTVTRHINISISNQEVVFKKIEHITVNLSQVILIPENIFLLKMCGLSTLLTKFPKFYKFGDFSSGFSQFDLIILHI